MPLNRLFHSDLDIPSKSDRFYSSMTTEPILSKPDYGKFKFV